jgi:hypothetical protein
METRIWRTFQHARAKRPAITIATVRDTSTGPDSPVILVSPVVTVNDEDRASDECRKMLELRVEDAQTDELHCGPKPFIGKWAGGLNLD